VKTLEASSYYDDCYEFSQLKLIIKRKRSFLHNRAPMWLFVTHSLFKPPTPLENACKKFVHIFCTKSTNRKIHYASGTLFGSQLLWVGYNPKQAHILCVHDVDQVVSS
jgi:hypothetical protein